MSTGNTRDAADHLPTPEPSSQPQRRASSPLSDAPSTPSRKTNIRESQEEDEDEDAIVVPSSKRRRISPEKDLQGTPTRKSSRLHNLDTPQSGLSYARGRSSHHQTASSPPNVLDIGSPETSGDDDDAIVSRPATRRRVARTTARGHDPFVVSDDDDEELVNVSGTRRSKSRTQARNTSSRGNDFVVDDDEIEYISSDGDQVSAKPSRKNKHKKRTRHEQNEIDDDLKDLQTSDLEEDAPVTGRTRGGPVNTERDRTREHFEILKRRRAGEKVPRIADSDQEEGADYDFGEDDGADIEAVTHNMPGQFLSLQQREDSSTDDEQEQDDRVEEVDEDEFVVDDEDDRRPGHSGIPLQFTSFASSKPKELFIHIIEWLVKNRIAPAFSRTDELYTLSWNKINDQLKAQAGSRLISSAWNANFKNAILARPQMQVEYVSSGEDESYLDCDACNRTNHPARYEFRFGGHAYDENTLEPIDEDDEEDDGEDANTENEDQANDKASYDQAGHLLPSANTKFYLGRFCAANAEMGHKLTHWKYHLNQGLLAYLEEQGVLSAEAIVAREKLNKKKREKEAENIVDIMQETGVIDEMWRGLQDDLEDARYGMEDHVAKGGKRSKGRIGKVRTKNAIY